MAFQKSYTTKSGAVGDYHVIGSFHWNPDGEDRQVSALIQLYVNKAARNAGKEPLVPILGKFRLYGASFDTYVNKASLAASDNDIIKQLYVALKAVCDEAHRSSDTNRKENLTSDCGADFYHDAISV